MQPVLSRIWKRVVDSILSDHNLYVKRGSIHPIAQEEESHHQMLFFFRVKGYSTEDTVRVFYALRTGS